MRRIYVALAGLLLLAVLAQFFFAAFGAFAEPKDDASFAIHQLNGMLVIPAIVLLATVFAALSRAPGRLIGMTVLPLGLIVVQVLIGVVARMFNDTGDLTTTAGQAVFGLHAINALVIMGVVGSVLRRARALAAARPGTEPPPAAATSTASPA